MANTLVSLEILRVGPEGHHVHHPVDGGSRIFPGSMVASLNATGQMVAGTTAASGRCVGIACHDIDATLVADGVCQLKFETNRDFLLTNGLTTDAFSDASQPGSSAWMIDDNSVADNDGGATRQLAGIFLGMDPSGKVRIHISPQAP